LWDLHDAQRHPGYHVSLESLFSVIGCHPFEAREFTGDSAATGAAICGKTAFGGLFCLSHSFVIILGGIEPQALVGHLTLAPPFLSAQA
jgi:hypothetical protein